MRDNIIGLADCAPYGLGKSATGSTPGGHVPTIVWFEDYQPTDAPLVGGKNSSLGALFCAGLPVPPGFAVTADCYRKALADGGLTGQLDALTAAVDPRDHASLVNAGERARALIGSIDLAGGLADAIREAYGELCGRCGDGALPVAIRSSATLEDQPDASFAGEHDTYLWVRGADEVVRHVLRCWGSLFTDRGIAYRIERGYGNVHEAMSVGVQQMVLFDLYHGWAVGVPSRGPKYWPKEMARRNGIMNALRQWSPPPALGVPPEVITEPFTVMLWGITSESVKQWLGGAQASGGLAGFAASPGVAEGPARVILSADGIGDLQEGEVLVAPLTAPSWAPVFGKTAATVTDVGGIMSHAAIVCREYGLPAVTGTAFGTKTVKTGQRLRVDGNAGTVTIID